jgi:hypothetical protein
MSTQLRDIAEKNPNSKREVDRLLMLCQIHGIHADEMMTFHLVVVRVLVWLLHKVPV